VILVDIDGTLLTTSGAGRRAMAAGFVALFGRDPCDFPFGGMTDRAIARGGLERLAERADDAAIDLVLAAYLAELDREVATSKVAFCDGMEQALLAIEGRDGVAVGLGTGNVRAGARVKIEKVTRFDRFAFGGFGCDHEGRPELLRVGAERGAALLGAPLEGCRVVVIGDTPKDVAAAKAIGADSIAVATSSFTVEALAGCAPTFAFPTLAAPGAVDAILFG
jgi:phosphoglycolate phosphatase-like HAD superfamily hydrolase